MKKQGWWCLLLGNSFLTSLGFKFVVWDQYLQSFELIQVTTSVAIKCGKPQSLSLHKNVTQQPSISILSDEGRCSENYYYWVLFMLKLHIIVTVLINLPLPELVALYLLVCFLIILSCTVQKSLSPHLKPQMVYF